MNKPGYISGIILGTGIWLVAAPVSFGQSQDLSKLVNQRYQFQEAEKALKLGRISRYRQLEKQLRDYPLHPYLEYADLKRRLGNAKPREVKSFLHENADSPLAVRLQSRWLRNLARQGRWQLLIDNFSSTQDRDLLCSYGTRMSECPRDTPCRTARGIGTRVIPSLWHVTPSGASEPSLELLGSRQSPGSRSFQRQP